MEERCVFVLAISSYHWFYLSFAHEILAFFRIAADGGANRLSDAFKDPYLNRDFEKIVRSQDKSPSTYSGDCSLWTDIL